MTTIITDFAKVTTLPGSNRLAWNVSRNGIPFGQIWTFKNTSSETFGFTAATLKGDAAHFSNLIDAELFMTAAA